MRTFVPSTILFLLPLTLAATELSYINTPKLVSDNNGGVCYLRPVADSQVVVHRYADGYEEVYSSPEKLGVIGNTIACTPEYVFFTVNAAGSTVNKLYRQHFGVGAPVPVIDPQCSTGLTDTRFVATVGIYTKGSRVVAIVVDSRSDVVAVEIGPDGRHSSIVATLGEFSQFSGACVTAASFYALLNIGNQTQLMELTAKGVDTKLLVSANGDGSLACNNHSWLVGYHAGDDLVVVDSNGAKKVYANVPGRMNGLAISDASEVVAVVRNFGNQTFRLAGGAAEKLPDDCLRLLSMPSTLVVSNDRFTVGSYVPGR